jgi:phosphoserine phosphatase
VFTGRTTGVLNMREGKVTRLKDWLTASGHKFKNFDSTAYSDSINDLPLLKAANHAVAVDPDPMLRAQAQRRGWDIVSLARQV